MPLALAFAQAAPALAPVDLDAVGQLVTFFAQSPDACLFVVVSPDGPVGVLAGLVASYFLNPAVLVAQERALYVCPQWHGQGIGSALLDAFEAWGEARGVAAVLLSHFVDTPHVATMYTHRGYTPFEMHCVKGL